MKDFVHGGIGESSYCIPKQIKDIILILIYPPAYIFLIEYRNKKGFNISHVMVCFVLTCCFYFPGVIYAMSELRRIEKEEY